MFAQKNNGRILLKVFMVLAVAAIAGAYVFYSFQSTARVKLANRDIAVDAVTGSVTVFADGGYKELKSELGGRVIEAQAINKANTFKKGDPLVKLDTTNLDRDFAERERNYKADLERTKVELEDNPDEEVAKKALADATRLLEIGAIAEEQLKAAQRALAGVQKRMKLAELTRKKTEEDFKAAKENYEITKKKMTVPAPIDGQVLDPNTWEGALIGGGHTVATIFSNSRVVSAKISEESFGRVKLGQIARVRLLVQGTTEFEGTVSKLLPTADETQRFEVYLEVKAEREQLAPRSTGEVTITVAERKNAIVIPRRARFSGDKVFVVKDGRVQVRTVKVGFDSALNVIEILSGVEEGEQVIVDNLDEFRGGQRVRVDIVK